MTQTPSDVRHAYADADRSLRKVFAGVTAPGWERVSPCAGWSAADVVGHLVDAQRNFLGPLGVDLGARPDVAADPAGAWGDHADRVATALSDEELPAQTYDGFFRPTTVGETLDRFYVWDMVVHRWDVAQAVGADPAVTEAELDRIERGAEGFGEALHMDGICGPALEVPADATRETRVLAVLGRRA